MIIDAENLIVGRLATYATKKALLGEKVNIINCEEAIITGSKKEIHYRYLTKSKRGTPQKGPFFSKRPDMFVRRIIRGMLPYKKERGITAYRNIMCYISTPEELKKEKAETIKSAHISKLPTLKYMKIKDLTKLLGK